MDQMEVVSLDSLLPSTHPYRRFQAYLPDTIEALADVSQLKGADGYGVERLFRCLLLQFMEDLSDRELERYLEEKNQELANVLTCSDQTPTERFWATFEQMEKESKILQDCLDNHSRSKMPMFMMLMLRYGMLKKEELNEFSDELREQLMVFL